MIKESAIGVFKDAPSFIEGYRYYLRYHGPDVVRKVGPWLRRYEVYKALTAPPEAVERFGAVEGSYGELWYDSAESYLLKSDVVFPMTMPPMEKWGWKPAGQTVTIVSAVPTERFLIKYLDAEETQIIRWVCAIGYPEGVSMEEGDEWYCKVHAEEVKQQPGLLGFYSYGVVKELLNAPKAVQIREQLREIFEKHGVALPTDMEPRIPKARVSELWYENIEAWRKANVEWAHEYTPPKWGGQYPYVDMVSTFINLNPDCDFLKGNYIIP